MASTPSTGTCWQLASTLRIRTRFGRFQSWFVLVLIAIILVAALVAAFDDIDRAITLLSRAGVLVLAIIALALLRHRGNDHESEWLSEDDWESHKGES